MCPNIFNMSLFWLHRPAYEVPFTITSTRGVSGDEIPQLHTNFPQSSGEPPSALRGFDSVEVKPGQKRKIAPCLYPSMIRVFGMWKRRVYWYDGNSGRPVANG